MKQQTFLKSPYCLRPLPAAVLVTFDFLSFQLQSLLHGSALGLLIENLVLRY
jgi:hypothetical protein